MNAENKEFIRPIGDYRGLIVYKKGECIYDLTFHFANRFLDKKDRTVDQMVQAARSGKQNIIGGRPRRLLPARLKSSFSMSPRRVSMSFWLIMRIT